jgi:hypothetical protein
MTENTTDEVEEAFKLVIVQPLCDIIKNQSCFNNAEYLTK